MVKQVIDNKDPEVVELRRMLNDRWDRVTFRGWLYRIVHWQVMNCATYEFEETDEIITRDAIELRRMLNDNWSDPEFRGWLYRLLKRYSN